LVEKNDLKWISIGLAGILVITSLTTIYFYSEATRYQKLYSDTIRDLEHLTIRTNILINYGNGTRQWHNDTRVPVGSSAFNATLYVANVDYTVSPEFGIFVTAIDGVKMEGDKWWSFWYWQNDQWISSEIGAAQYILKNEGMVAWSYVSGFPAPPP